MLGYKFLTTKSFVFSSHNSSTSHIQVGSYDFEYYALLHEFEYAYLFPEQMLEAKLVDRDTVYLQLS